MPIIIDDTVIYNQKQNLQAAMTTDPNMRKVIQQHIRELTAFPLVTQSSSTSESKEEDPMHCPPPAQSSSFIDTRCVHLAEQETHIPSTDVGSLLCPVFIQVGPAGDCC